MCLKELQRRGGAHLAGDNALQIIFHRQFVDGLYLTGIDNKLQHTKESLLLMTLPVETVADGHIVQGESGERLVRGKGREAQLTELLSLPEQGAVGKLYCLRAADRLAFSPIRTVETKLDALRTDNANGHPGYIICTHRAMLSCERSRLHSCRMATAFSASSLWKSSSRGVISRPAISKAPGLTSNRSSPSL